jgi:glucose-1-phosphate cytidylyltransferase
MKTVILCGGRGTRIRDVSDEVPKPMVPIGGLPILWHIMKYYSSWGHRNFVLCLGYLGNTIRDFFLNYDAHTQDVTLALGLKTQLQYYSKHAELQWQITLAETGLDTMTGGRIKRIQQYVEHDDHFMLTYGDGLGTVDLDRLVAFHKSHGKILTITGVRPPSRFGELRLNANGLVTAFNEKPQVSQGRISGGFFVCRRDIFRYLNNREDLVFEQEPIKNLVRRKQVMVYKHDGFWQPMDTYRDYQYLNGLLEKKKAPWMIWK